MSKTNDTFSPLSAKHIVPGNHAESDYFALIRDLLAKRKTCTVGDPGYVSIQREIDKVYALIKDEIITNRSNPIREVSFGTSGWRGIIGKDITCRSIAQVTLAIIALYQELSSSSELTDPLGVQTLEEARRRGCVVGYDNRFGGDFFAQSVIDVLTSNGFTVHFAGESTTGALSAAMLDLHAAFSVNLTPSHNPLDYAGYKYNAADAGPASSILTTRITENARKLISEGNEISLNPDKSLVKPFSALDSWKNLVRKGCSSHGIDYDAIVKEFIATEDIVVAVDSVHGASRVHIRSLFNDQETDRLIHIRSDSDPTFGGIAPEPSAANMVMVKQTLAMRKEPLKLGVIIDPDADRIRFTDGANEISMNEFGAMCYHYLHEVKKKKGMVAKTVATSNFANALASSFGEEVFEPRVGFKEFKPVINKALVYFEESDGISMTGHTPEKDAYIGLFAAMDMVMHLKKNLGEYLVDLKEAYGSYFPDRDGVVVSQQGDELKETLAILQKYDEGSSILIGGIDKKIKKVIAIDGRKMIFEDDSWIMIRPSGTEPKVRFYVEARTEEGKNTLFDAAKAMLAEIGLI